MAYDEFQAYIHNLNTPRPVILLIGKRKVKQEDQSQLIGLGEKLAKDLPQCLFRSGNAGGADALFTQGVMQIASDRMQVVLPYKGHQKSRRNKNSSYYALEPAQLAEEDQIVYTTKQLHPGSQRMIPGYLQGQKNKLTAKAAYLLRDTLMVMGDNELGLTPASFTLFYDDLDKPMQGGTGLTINVCRKMDIPAKNQLTWMKW